MNPIAKFKMKELRRRARLLHHEAEQEIQVKYIDGELYVTYFDNPVCRIVDKEDKGYPFTVSQSRLKEYINYLRRNYIAAHRQFLR